MRIRRFSDELNPRALTLKSLTPLCTTSTPGTCIRAVGACPVIDWSRSVMGSTTAMAAGASTTRSGVRDAANTMTSPREMVCGWRRTSARWVAPAATVRLPASSDPDDNQQDAQG